MNYRIEKRDAFRVVGVKLETTIENDEGLRAIPEFWGKTHQSGMTPKILSLMNKEPFGLLGLSVGNFKSDSRFDYYIAVSSDKEIPEGMTEYEVPACQWAIFECIGPMPTAIQDLGKRIMTEWLPTSGYDYGNAPDIEVYGEGDTSAVDYKCQVWLPVVKK